MAKVLEILSEMARTQTPVNFLCWFPAHQPRCGGSRRGMCSHSFSIVSHPETTSMNQDSAAGMPSLLAHLGPHFLPSSGERLQNVT